MFRRAASLLTFSYLIVFYSDNAIASNFAGEINDFVQY